MILIDLLLWLLVAILAVIAATHSRALMTSRLREGAADFLRLIPRIFVGVVGSGYIAEALPHEVIARWLGPGSGTLGITLAVIGGAITPGGPVVGFSIGVAALKGGAGVPQVIAYLSAWALFAIQRLVMWELPVVPARFVWLRAAVSLPLPFLAAAFAMLLGKP
jgi:uncharacterized membrane protein YraQ (UPF0718 family)